METLANNFWLMMIAAALVLGGLAIAWRVLAEKTIMPYEPRGALLTRAELRFLRSLREAVGDHLVICPMVRFEADILRVRKQTPKPRGWLNRILAKHIDFVLCDEDTMRVVVAIELDDASHQRPDRIQRDEFVDQAFHDAGVPLLRVPVTGKYDVEQLREAIDEIAGELAV